MAANVSPFGSHFGGSQFAMWILETLANLLFFGGEWEDERIGLPLYP